MQEDQSARLALEKTHGDHCEDGEGRDKDGQGSTYNICMLISSRSTMLAMTIYLYHNNWRRRSAKILSCCCTFDCKTFQPMIIFKIMILVIIVVMMAMAMLLVTIFSSPPPHQLF